MVRFGSLAVLVLGAGCGRSHFDPCGPIDGSSSSDASDAAPLDVGLLLHYSFDEAAPPFSDAAGHDDTICTAGCPLRVGGKVGAGAISFDGNDCLRIGDAPDLRPSRFTISVWSSTQSAAGAIFSRPYMELSTGMNTFLLGVVMNGGFYWQAEAEPAIISAFISAGWHHLAVTFDSSTLTMYIDGFEVGANTGAALYGADSFFIGCDLDSGAASRFYQGQIDDLRFYDHVLAPTEIIGLAQQ